ncbi:FAD-dependent monooxygenase [Salinicoccus sp. ID82-1]|uniref:FAD-dependent monooxygenase n=1 Tax=Salinicoccus sp. ID82-1 TaxID=2820269 RepID=UPI001F025C94|nr:FAD-dependent monooxygenase [Salinicoccus sp. ID82-1]MCG1010725.1 FAD-dependent monooxygenase [Salinicoccus sp. ID82-1]
MEQEVLIVGAGPTGLALALGLEKQGVPFRIIDRNAGPGTTSRAMVVHARTLEFYRQLDMAHALIEAGIVEDAVHLYKNREEVSRVPLGEMGKGLSPFPFVLSLAQDIHESILVEWLKSKHILVEWNTELVAFDQQANHVEARISKNGRQDYSRFAYICGCDGAHSTVRKQLDIGFPGGTYSQMFFVADVVNEKPFKGFSAGFRGSDFKLALNIRTTGNVRLIGIIPDALLDDGPPEAFAPLIPHVEKVLPVKVGAVNWYSSYKVHHRVAENFRQGRAFILGDAGHIHSPAGGQGMNTGIGDAFNLAWKFAMVLEDRMNDSVLDTYETERIGFARKLVSTTDRAFQLVVGSRTVRNVVIPYVIPKVLKSSKLRKEVFKMLSQTKLSYHDSLLSSGRIGAMTAGDRLPWVQTHDGDNYEPLKSADWQMHVYGKPNSKIKRLSDTSGLPLHYTHWTKEMKQKGINRDSAFLIRPDGYIGVAATTDDTEVITRYIRQFDLRMK